MRVTLVAIFAISIFPLGEPLIRPLEARYPANPELSQANGIIIIEGAEATRRTEHRDQVQLNEVEEWFTDALALARYFVCVPAILYDRLFRTLRLDFV